MASTEIMTLNMGPQHPSTHGVLRMVLELDGEVIKKITPHIGYLHRGVEKLSEHRTYHQTIPLTDRLDYLAPMSNNLGYVLAVEKLLGIEVPERAQTVRVILTELTRLKSHLVWIACHALDIGAEAAHPEIVARHAGAGDLFIELHDLFPLAEGIDENRHGANIEGVAGDPDQV